MSVVTKGTLWFYPSLKAEIERVARAEGVTQSALVNVIVSMALSDEQQVKKAVNLLTVIMARIFLKAKITI